MNWEEYVSNGRVLVVADRLKTRKTMIAVLKERGYDVVAVATSEDAVEHTQRRNLAYDLAFVDLNIRNGEAMRVLPQLRDLNPHIVAIAVTRHAERETIQEAFRLGAVAFVASVTELADFDAFMQKMMHEAGERRRSMKSEHHEPATT